jgi:hypothetical protein
MTTTSTSSDTIQHDESEPYTDCGHHTAPVIVTYTCAATLEMRDDCEACFDEHVACCSRCATEIARA